MNVLTEGVAPLLRIADHATRLDRMLATSVGAPAESARYFGEMPSDRTAGDLPCP